MVLSRFLTVATVVAVGAATTTAVAAQSTAALDITFASYYAKQSSSTSSSSANETEALEQSMQQLTSDDLSTDFVTLSAGGDSASMAVPDALHAEYGLFGNHQVLYLQRKWQLLEDGVYQMVRDGWNGLEWTGLGHDVQAY